MADFIVTAVATVEAYFLVQADSADEATDIVDQDVEFLEPYDTEELSFEVVRVEEAD